MRSTDPRKRHFLRSLRCARSGTGTAHPDSGAAGSTAAGTRQQPQPPVYPQQPVYQQPVYPQQPVYDPADHTAEFDPEDVSQNKVIAMAAYILGTVGIIIALLAAPQSKYAAFHSRQALKLDIVSTLLLIVSAVLAFTSLCRLPALSALQFSSSCASSASSRYAAAKQRTPPSSASCRS